MDQSPRSFFNAVFAGNEYLLFDVERVITSIDFNREAFAWINKNKITSSLQITDDAFLDICLLAGFDYIPTFPLLIDQSGSAFSFKCTISEYYYNII